MNRDPRSCTCSCHQGANIFCSCFGPCCDEPYWTPAKTMSHVSADCDCPCHRGIEVLCNCCIIHSTKAFWPLLTRDQFREGVFKRDNHQCVICKAPAKDAHHILERRLWGDGGYYMPNGASVCEEHHLAAERTTLSCEEVREAAGIKDILLPSHLYKDQRYDKWGNPILSNGTRLRGDIFFDESVQKVLGEGNVLSLFTHHVKYPRSHHLPWSPGMTKDDRVMEGDDPFAGQQVVVTVKLDGENTTMYSDRVHARSIEYDPHPSRNWVKALHARIAHDIPDSWRVCGENLWAEHSIGYKNLDDFFVVFSVWNERNICLSWTETQEYAALLGFKTVPVLYEGPGDRKYIEKLYQKEFQGDPMEGYVVRRSGSFSYSEFRRALGKYVRPGHNVNNHNWKHQQVKPNKLRTNT